MSDEIPVKPGPRAGKRNPGHTVSPQTTVENRPSLWTRSSGSGKGRVGSAPSGSRASRPGPRPRRAARGADRPRRRRRGAPAAATPAPGPTRPTRAARRGRRRLRRRPRLGAPAVRGAGVQRLGRDRRRRRRRALRAERRCATASCASAPSRRPGPPSCGCSRGTLLARIVAELGPDVVTRIVVTGPVAPSWKHGPRSVRGARGPRDTYG